MTTNMIIGMVDSVNRPCPPLAVFDLDGTLIRGDSFLPFLMSYAWRQRRFVPFLVLPFYLTLYACRILSDWRAKERVLIAFLRGERKDQVAEHAERFCERWVRPRLRDEVVARLIEHQKAGHRVVLMSASPDVYVLAIGRLFGIDEVECTRVVSSSDHWDGALKGLNCKGPQKIEALKALLVADRMPAESFAYGDSTSDLPLLRWVRHGFLVQGGRLTRLDGE